jgi:hypothetical protein
MQIWKRTPAFDKKWFLIYKKAEKRKRKIRPKSARNSPACGKTCGKIVGNKI